MRHIHIEMIGGLAGDIFLAAAIDAGIIERDALEQTLRLVGLGPVEVVTEKVVRNGITSTHVSFAGWDPSHERDHRHLTEIEAMLGACDLPDAIKRRSIAMFRDLGQAESDIHGTPLDHVHFHEVGAVDSILDFVGAAYVIEHAQVTWSHGAVPQGHGFIKTDHGPLPALAPATARLLAGFTMQPVDVEGETVTPTGAAILRALDATELPPAVTLSGDGFGAGTKVFPTRANVTRMAVYDVSDTARANTFERDVILRLQADIDDLSPEVLAYTSEQLLDAGALDVSHTHVSMKKGRPGIQLTVLCEAPQRDALAHIVFSETSTFGIRVETIERLKLRRRIDTVSTPYGELKVKVGTWGEHMKVAAEYEDCAEAARRTHTPLTDVMKAAVAAWHEAHRGETE